LEAKKNETIEIVKNVEKTDDINSLDSTKKGLVGNFENIFRQFKNIGFSLLLVPIGLLYILCLGVSLAPGLFVLQKIHYFVQQTQLSMIVTSFLYGLGIGFGFVLFIFTLIFIVPLCNLPLIPLVRSYRGPWFSIESIPWYYHNALTYLVRYTILEFLTPSPLNNLFFKMMGMKIGKGVMINTTNISDPCLIILDDYVTIGGSAFLMAHYGMKGFLIIDKLHLKKGAMVGLGAKILGGVTIGEKATILPNSAVLPKTIVKDGEKFGVSSMPL
jgi:hypothetical protein